MTLLENYYMLYFGILAVIGILILIQAYFKGAILQLLDIFASIASIYVSYVCCDYFATNYAFYKQNSGALSLLNSAIWFIILWLGCQLIYLIIETIIKWLTKDNIIGFFDHVLGLLLGMVKVFLIYAVICIGCMTSFVTNGEDFINKTPMSYVQKGLSYLEGVMHFETK